MRQFPLLLFALACFFIQGCTIKSGELQPIPSPEEIWKKIPTQEGELSLRAVAKTTIHQEGGRYVQRMALIMQKPSLLRAEAIPPIGMPNFFLSVTDQTLKAYLPYRGEVYLGSPQIAYLEPIFPTGIPIAQLIPLLMGSLPSKRVGLEQTIRGSRDGKYHRLEVFFHGKKGYAVTVDPRTQTMVSFEAYGEGNPDPLYRAEMSDYRKVADLLFPFHISIRPEDDRKPALTVEYLEVEKVFPMDINDFDLTVPPGIKLIYLH